MIYRNSDRLDDVRWLAEPDLGAGEIVRDFLMGERNLIELERGYIAAVDDLEQFLRAADGLPLSVERGATGEILVRPIGTSESLFITGRTAEVITGYIDRKPVWMDDRFEMTLRRRLHLMYTGTL